MTDFRDQTFDGGTVRLDGNRFYNCLFTGGVIVEYGAMAEVHIEADCRFHQVQWFLDGAAGSTIQFLNMVHNAFPLTRPMVDYYLRTIAGPMMPRRVINPDAPAAQRMQRPARPGQQPST